MKDETYYQIRNYDMDDERLDDIKTLVSRSTEGEMYLKAKERFEKTVNGKITELGELAFKMMWRAGIWAGAAWATEHPAERIYSNNTKIE